jgi:hypothetical protein
MKHVAAAFLFLLSSVALATLPLQASLERLASDCDHILAGHVVGVDMIDGEGKEITDVQAMTGPGLKNTILLIIKVDEVFFSRVKTVPETIKVPLDSMMHFSLGEIREAHQEPSETRLLILQGKCFEPIVPGVFFRSLEDKDQALQIRAKAQGSNKTIEPTR